MGMTITEKILARASGKKVVRPGEIVEADISVAMTTDISGTATLLTFRELKIPVWDKEKVVMIVDHCAPPSNLLHAGFVAENIKFAEDFGIPHFHNMQGVCHQILPEEGYVKPGMVIVGVDSHTTTYGAFGAAGTGIGTTDMAYVFATGRLWFKVPETIQICLAGKLPARVMSKDILLYIAGKYSAEVAQYKAVEFVGPLAEEMSIASRMTMSNMAVEIGAKFGFFVPDQKVSDFLKGRTQKPFSLITPDADAHYESVYRIDVSSLEPQIAFPFSVDNVRPISAAGEIKIQQAFIGSCTNGRLEDLHAAAGILEGKKVHPDVRLLVIPASWEIYLQAMKDKTLETLIRAGAVIGNASCAACFGAHMGLLGSEENCIAAINRNFKGRMGSPKAQVFLASPATVAASALEGKITDPRKY